jgi:hypothetical protein
VKTSEYVKQRIATLGRRRHFRRSRSERGGGDVAERVHQRLATLATRLKIEIGMANSGSDFTESSKSHAKP